MHVSKQVAREEGLEVLAIAEHEGRAEDAEAVVPGLVPLHPGDEEPLGTGDHVLELRRVRLAELAVGEDLDLDLAVGELRDPFGEELGRLTLVGLRRGHMPGLEHDVGCGRSLTEPCGADRHRRRVCTEPSHWCASFAGCRQPLSATR